MGFIQPGKYDKLFEEKQQEDSEPTIFALNPVTVSDALHMGTTTDISIPMNFTAEDDVLVEPVS